MTYIRLKTVKKVPMSEIASSCHHFSMTHIAYVFISYLFFCPTQPIDYVPMSEITWLYVPMPDIAYVPIFHIKVYVSFM